MIFYFSATGNTRWAAKQLAEATGDSLVFIADALGGDCHYELAEGERIGFVFPVHGWRPPLIVRQFVSRLKLDGAEGHFCYALVTAGDDIGETMEILNSDLTASVGIRAESLYSLIMPESYVGLPFMDVDKPEKEQQKLSRAAVQLQVFTEEIKSCQRGIVRTYKGHWPRVNSRLLGAAFVGWLVSDKKFRVESDRCTKCGLCAEVCMVDNISRGKDRAPEWKHTGRCLTCFACYHHCPSHAIEFGNQTRNKGQYFWKMKNER